MLFRRLDIVGITRSITKYGVTVRNREDLGRIIREAFYIARTGRPGPVLIDLPKDVMGELGSAEYPSEVNIQKDISQILMYTSGSLSGRLKCLAKQRIRCSLREEALISPMHRNCLRNSWRRQMFPVVTTVMGRGAVPTDHPLFIGNLGMHGAYAANMAVNNL